MRGECFWGDSIICFEVGWRGIGMRGDYSGVTAEVCWGGDEIVIEIVGATDVGGELLQSGD